MLSWYEEHFIFNISPPNHRIASCTHRNDIAVLFFHPPNYASRYILLKTHPSFRQNLKFVSELGEGETTGDGEHRIPPPSQRLLKLALLAYFLVLYSTLPLGHCHYHRHCACHLDFSYSKNPQIRTMHWIKNL